MSKTKFGGQFSRGKVCLRVGLAALGLAFFVWVQTGAAQIVGNLQITEIMYDPFGNDEKREWLEIFNASEAPVNLLGYKFFENNVNHGLVLVLGENILAAGGYGVIAENPEQFLKEYPTYVGNLWDSAFSLSNTGEKIAIKNELGQVVAEVEYSKTAGANDNGYSLELENANWRQSYVLGGTPGQPNSAEEIIEEAENQQTDETQEAEVEICQAAIVLSEILPTPLKGQLEFVEVRNDGNAPCDLFGWSVADLKNNHADFPENSLIGVGGYVALVKNIGLNSSNETVFLKNGEKIIQAVSYKSGKTNASYNFDGNNWRWSKFLTPGQPNQFNNPPVSQNKIPQEAYVNVWAEFSAKAQDADGEKLKYAWDFGDGHKSYLAATRHKYASEGAYQGSLKITDGSEDQLFPFMINVTDYPERKMKIITVNPNPPGKDTQKETIILKNESKKKINLEGWSVATGWKNLINHPILEKLFVAPGKTAEITWEICKFTLGNQQAKIELRYPNGEVADKVKYKLAKSMAEGDAYVRDGKNWSWVNQKPITKKQITKSVTGNQPSVTSNQGGESVEEDILEEEVGGQSVVGQQLASSSTSRSGSLVTSNLNSMKVGDKIFEPKVLGAEDVREVGGEYFFGKSNNLPEEHYALAFLRNFVSNLNAKLNLLVNYFL